MLVPNQAPQISQQGPYVFVVKPDGTAELRLVTLGQRQGDRRGRDRDLPPASEVVTTGQLVSSRREGARQAPGKRLLRPNEQVAGRVNRSGAGRGA